MNHEQVLEQVYQHIGGAANISFYNWKNDILYLTVKDVGMVNLTALQKMEHTKEVQLTRSRITIQMQSNEYKEELKMAKDYSVLVSQVVELVGGEANVTEFTHCITRLRFTVKNKENVKSDEIKKIKGVVGCNWSGAQFQIIIGQGVDEVYQMICDNSGLKSKETAPETNKPKEKVTVKSVLNGALQHFVASVIPVVPLLMGTGLLKSLLIILNLMGVLTSDTSTYQLLYFVADAGLYFLPVYVGFTTAKHFGATPVLGALMGAMLIHPTFVAAESPFTLFGLAVPTATYTSSVIPAFLTVLTMSYLEKLLHKYIPKVLRTIVAPMLVIMIMVPISFLLLAPLGTMVGNIITGIFIWLDSKIGFVALTILAFMWPLIVMTGMHYSFMPHMFQSYATGGDYVSSNVGFLSNVTQGATCLAVALKTKKNEDVRSTAISAAISAFAGGITEPALYGITLRFKTPLIAAMIGNAAGGAIMGINHVCKAVIGGGGTIYGNLPTYVTDDPWNLIWCMIAIIAAIVISFILTLILYKAPVEEVA